MYRLLAHTAEQVIASCPGSGCFGELMHTLPPMSASCAILFIPHIVLCLVEPRIRLPDDVAHRVDLLENSPSGRTTCGRVPADPPSALVPAFIADSFAVPRVAEGFVDRCDFCTVLARPQALVRPVRAQRLERRIPEHVVHVRGCGTGGRRAAAQSANFRTCGGEVSTVVVRIEDLLLLGTREGRARAAGWIRDRAACARGFATGTLEWVVVSALNQSAVAADFVTEVLHRLYADEAEKGQRQHEARYLNYSKIEKPF